MPPSEPPTQVIVRVKVPPGHIRDTTLDEFTLGILDTSLSVSSLRQRIQTLVPSNPQPQHQRILYGGRALIDDTQSLADALNTRRDTTQNEYVVHLLIRDGADHSRSGSNTPGVHHGEQRPIQPQPIHGQPASLPDIIRAAALGQVHLQDHIGSGGQGMARVPSRPEGRAGVQTSHHNSGSPAPQTTDGQSAASQGGLPGPQLHHHHHSHPHPHHHHHHHPHTHQHGANLQSDQHGQGPPRPLSGQDFRVEGIGPNGERFSIHQQTVNVPLGVQNGQPNLPFPMGVPGMPGLPTQMNHGAMHGTMPLAAGQIPGFGLPFPLPGMAQQPQPSPQPAVVSALDRARNNMGEMRRMLEELRLQNASAEGQTRIAELEQRLQAVNDYLDPLHLGARPPRDATARPRSAGAATQFPQRPTPHMHIPNTSGHLPFGFGLPMPPSSHLAGHTPLLPMPQQQPLGVVSTYLLSSPEGPRALVFTPEHGTFAGRGLVSVSQVQAGTPITSTAPPGTSSALALQATPTTPLPRPNDQQGQAANAPQANALDQQPGPQQDDPFAVIQPFMGHLWLLLRIMIFGYFLLGSNFGWRRPVALVLLGLGFWMIRIGLLGNGGLIRRWWEDILRMDDVRNRILRGRLMRMGVDLDAAMAQAGNNNQVPNENPAQPQEAPIAAGDAPRDARPQAGRPQQQPFPTPEQLAERLMRRNENDPLRRLREQIRPLERAVALFAASLWPGVGERYVQALDQAREEEMLAETELQRQQEERRAREAAEAEKKDVKTDSGEAQDEAPTSDKSEKEVRENEARTPIEDSFGSSDGSSSRVPAVASSSSS